MIFSLNFTRYAHLDLTSLTFLPIGLVGEEASLSGRTAVDGQTVSSIRMGRRHGGWARKARVAK